MSINVSDRNGYGVVVKLDFLYIEEIYDSELHPDGDF